MKQLKRIEGMVADIFKVLNGNGEDGLKTKQRLTEQKVNLIIENLPSNASLKWHAAIGGCAGIFVLFIGYVIIKLCSS